MHEHVWQAARLALLSCALLAPAARAAAQGGGTGAPAGGSTATPDGNVSNGRENQPSRPLVQQRERVAGVADRNAAAQDRELDAIGNKLLRDTPRNPVGADTATGGGTTP